MLDLVDEHDLLAGLDVRADADGELGVALEALVRRHARASATGGVARRSDALLAPVEVARAAPEALVERGPSARARPSSSPGHGSARARLGRRLAVEGLLEPGLLLGLEERVVLERIVVE